MKKALKLVKLAILSSFLFACESTYKVGDCVDKTEWVGEDGKFQGNMYRKVTTVTKDGYLIRTYFMIKDKKTGKVNHIEMQWEASSLKGYTKIECPTEPTGYVE